MNNTVKDYAVRMVQNDLRVRQNDARPKYTYWKRKRGEEDYTLNTNRLRNDLTEIMRAKRDRLGLDLYKSAMRILYKYSLNRKWIDDHLTWDNTEQMWVIVDCGADTCDWEAVQWGISVIIQTQWEQRSPDNHPHLFWDTHPEHEELDELIEQHELYPQEKQIKMFE